MGRLISFFTIFFCIYGTIHFYLAWKLRRALYLEGIGFFLMVPVLGFLMLSPILARLLTAQGTITAGLIVTWIGFVWMGLVFIFICVSLPLDLYHMCMAALQNLFDIDLIRLMFSRRQSLLLSAAAALSIMLYGAREARQIEIEEVVLSSTKVPAAMDGLRIVQISDVHIGPMFYPGRLEGILKAVAAARPDILVSTGDLIDGRISDPAASARLLKTIAAPQGKFAVLGNHEFYAGVDASIDFFQQAGFKTLRGDSVAVNDFLTIAGVDDPSGGAAAVTDEKAMLERVPREHFTLLLKHRPIVEAATGGRIDLQLSGHTHKGQIFPFTLLIKRIYPHIAGLYTVAGTPLYVSRGTGTWGPPVRVLARPEVTLITLRAAAAGGIAGAPLPRQP